MNAYPDWVDLLRYLGLDPITVWVEYRVLLYCVLALVGILIIGGLYLGGSRVRGVIANYQHAFADRMSFHRSMTEVRRKDRDALTAALNGDRFVFAVPAIAHDDVPGFNKSVGYVMLTQTRLIFTSKGQKVEFALDSFDDANVRDGNKHMELKLIFENRKPIFHLLGISRDHAQEMFMKMHAFRLNLKSDASRS